jgi:imidazolonepropionase-like amidohydrolase
MKKLGLLLVLWVIACAPGAFALTSGYDVLIPAATRGDGVASSLWRTDLYIFNPGEDAASTVVFWLARDRANASSRSRSFVIAPGECLVLKDAVLETFGMPSAGGAFRVVADREVVVSSRIYNLKGSVTFGQGFIGVPRQDAVRAGETTDVIGLSESSAFRTNIILVDASDSDSGSDVSLSLRTRDGSEIASSNYHLRRLEPKLFPATDLGVSGFENATLHVQVTRGAAIVMASKIDNDPATGDPTSLAPWASADDSAAHQLVLTGGTLIDGNGGDPVNQAAVVIQGSRIVYAGPASSVEIPAGAQVIEIDGHSVLPGFFNTHVHEVSFTNGAPGDSIEVSRLAAWAWEGVTTIRDVTSPMSRLQQYRRAYWAHKDPRLARLLISGPCFEVPGGRAESYNRLIITSVDDARQKTEQLIDAGADLVKLYFEDGSIFNEEWNVMSTDEARAIVGVAHGRGKLATVHVQEAYLVEQALDAGVDDICHSQVDGPVPDHLIRRMAEQGVYLVPTLEMSNTYRPYLMVSLANLRRMVEAGVQIAIGTDYSFTFPIEFELGMPLREMLLMQQGGMTPMQIIVAGTRNSANVCGLESELGTIERGKTADLIVVEGDPLEDLSVLKHNLKMVIHYGEIIRNELN